MDRFLDLQDTNELSIGDEITIHNTGAYSMVLAPLFIEEIPDFSLQDDSSIHSCRESPFILKAESFYDFVVDSVYLVSRKFADRFVGVKDGVYVAVDADKVTAVECPLDCFF